MPKANRTCYCCGREYYFCPSCPSDRKDPLIYTMWDSEICKDIFNTLTKESTKKITTKECKNKLVELGADKVEINKESVKRHFDRVMSYTDVEDVKNDVEVTAEVIEIAEVTEVTEEIDNVEIETNEIIEVAEIAEIVDTTEEAKETPKMSVKKRRNSYKNNN